ncbi:MAG: hypothetical protein ACI9FJ_002880 [Alteromonadaceae bacterium]|jgi:hypothetical protein
MNKHFKVLASALLLNSLLLTAILPSMVFAGHSGKKSSCKVQDVKCARAVTSAFAPNGALWRLWAAQDQLFYSVSNDDGLHFGASQKITINAQSISAREENRPKLVFGGKDNVYISWARPNKSKHTSQVKFIYSTDGGQHFSMPQTVNDGGGKIKHSYNEMVVTDDGTVVINWLGGKRKGSVLYSAYGKLSDGQFKFSSKKLAQGTCVCCRIASSYTADNKVAVMWRNIYDDNIRDHAILTFDQHSADKTPFRATFDQWQINGCPHQGPGLSVGGQNRYHMVWFNNGEKAKGIFYAYSDNNGETTSKPLNLGGAAVQASYANVLSNGKNVDVVWTQFNGDMYQLYHQRSTDRGQTFNSATVVAQSADDPDRPFLIKKQGHNFVSWQQPNVGHQVIAL